MRPKILPLIREGRRPTNQCREIPAHATFAQKPNAGLIALPHALTIFNASMIVALAQRYRMPSIYAQAEAVAIGGLVSYGLNWNDQFRRAAEYVDRVLKGTSPADLPVQEPTKYHLAVNLKTAKALGLELPPQLLGLKRLR
jgi:putative ABC transport system substrate-binding protein